MLPTSLLTNEVKDRAGTEVEFEHRKLEGREHIYIRKGGSPSLPTFLKVGHQETGTGSGAMQRSRVGIDMDVVGKSGKTCKISVYKTWVIPTGELDDLDDVKDASAMLDSFNCTTGAATAVLFDGTGNGNSAGINATL